MGASHISGPLIVSDLVYSGGFPCLPGNVEVHSGTYFWVSSTTTGASNSNAGTDKTAPCATIAGAVAKCTASAGDVILVMEGHVETLTGAAAIAFSVAGVTVIGLGNGLNRPTLTLATPTTTTMTIAGANVTIKNIRITSTVAALATVFSITGAGVTLDTVDYYEDGTTDCLGFVLTTTAADDLTIKNCHWYRGTTAATALSQWVILTGVDRFKALNNFMILKGFTTSNPINSVFAVVTTACVGIEIVGNRIYDSNSTGNVAILTIANCTGVISDNRIGTSQGTLALALALNSCFSFENYMTNEVAKGGVLEPAADAA